MTTSISTDFLAIIALCFTICLSRRNIIFNNHKNKIYISMSIAVIILLLLEIATVLMEHSSNSNLVLPYRLANIIGFSLCPLVPVFLLLFNKNIKKSNFFKSFLALPFYINMLMCILSYKTGWIFFVNEHNLYTRGKLFLLPTIISLIYFILLVIIAMKNSVEYENDDRIVLIAIFLVPVLGTILQVLFKDLLLIWISVSISLLLYYIFLRELQFKYDIQTGIKNRSAFEKEMEKYLKDDKNAAIVMLDLNGLKSINDRLGHKAGDEIIIRAAKIIEESFIGIGNTFRIGGDEFCVICKEVSKKLLDDTLSDLDQLLLLTNQENNNKIELAYGYSFYTKNKGESIYSTFHQADKAMYIHKAKLKGFCKSRDEVANIP